MKHTYTWYAVQQPAQHKILCCNRILHMLGKRRSYTRKVVYTHKRRIMYKKRDEYIGGMRRNRWRNTTFCEAKVTYIYLESDVCV